MDNFSTVVGIVGTVIIGLVALAVVWNMWNGRISLAELLSDSTASSLSRFQFLVFTFIIGLSYLLLVIGRASGHSLDALPDVSDGALKLLGISAGSYVASKAIQKAADTSVQKTQIDAQSNPPAAAPAPVRHGAVA